MATENLTIVYPKGAMEVRGGTPIAQDGTVANNANAYGVLEADIKWPETTGAVIVSGEVNYDWACSNSGIGIVKEAADAMSGITFVQDDGEPYVFPCSGGGNVTDPILENAKSTGGIGYTTEGEATTITWDGDTSGLAVINGLAPFPYYKVGEAVELTALQGATVNASGDFAEFFPHTILDSEINEIVEGLYAVRVETEPNQYLAMLIVCIETGEYYGLQIEGGVYFPKDGEDFMVSSLAYTSETIHKIDTKYLDIDSLKTALGLS